MIHLCENEKSENFDQIKALSEHLFKELPILGKQISQQGYFTDLAQFKDPSSPENLNNFKKLKNLGGLIICFTTEAQLCTMATLKFTSDSQGINDLVTLSTGKEERKDFSPLVFTTSQVYASCSINYEAIALYERG
jgi:hypothetical protein